MEERDLDIRVFINVTERLYREMIGYMVAQQTDMSVVPFDPDDTEASLWRILKETLKHSGPDVHPVVVLSCDESSPNALRYTSDRLLTEFTNLLIVAIDLGRGSISTLHSEVRCDRIPCSPFEMVSTIRSHCRTVAAP